MKRLTLLFCVFLLFTLGANAQTFTEDFSGGSVPSGWVGNGNYGLSVASGALTINVNKNVPDQFFTYNFSSNQDFSGKAFMNIKLRGDKPYTLQVKIFSSSGTSFTSPLLRVTTYSPFFTEYCIDFSSFTGKGSVNKIEYAVNPSALSYGGKIYFDDVKIGTASTQMAGIASITDVLVFKGDTGKKILVTDIKNAGTITVGASALMTGVTVTTPATAPFIGSISTIKFNASATPGTAVISVTAVGTGSYTNNITTFNLTVEDDIVPTVSKPADISVPVGKATKVVVSGISDGNKSVDQVVKVTAASSNATAIPVPVVEYDTLGSPYATLTINAASAGTSTITITVKDNGATNNTNTTTFDVTAYAGFNNAPVIKTPTKQAMYDKSPFKLNVLLEGLGDGDNNTQTLTITATNKTGIVTPTSPVTWAAGKDTASLLLTSSGTGKDTITVTVTDNGNNGSNNGNQTTIVSFPIEVLAPAPSGYIIPMVDLSADTLSDFIKVESIDVSQYASYIDTLGKRCIRLELKGKSDWTGIWFDLSKIPLELDLTNNPYMTYEIMGIGINPIATHAYFVDAEWGEDKLETHRNANGAHLERTFITTPNPNVFTKVIMDFRAPDYLNNSSGEMINISRIDQILLNYHKTDMDYPNTTINGVIYISDIRLGDQCTGIPTITPVCTVDPKPAKVVWSGSSAITDELTGITNGLGNTTGVTVTVLSSKPAFIANPTAGSLSSDGKLSITFTPGSTVDSAQIIVRVNCTGSTQKEMRYWIKTASDVATNAATITIDASVKGQTIQGFGGFEPPVQLLDQYAMDQGCKMMRITIDPAFEKVNDNSDPNTLNREGFDKSKIDFDYIKKAADAGVTHFFVSLWSPPAWMMQSLSEVWVAGAPAWSTTTQKVDPNFYDEYVEYMVAITRMIKEETGVELAGFCPQNEPAFTEPYGSGILDPVNMAKVCGMLGKRYSDEGFKTKPITSSQVFTQGTNSVIDYANAVKNDPLKQYTKVVGNHYPNDETVRWAAQWSAAKGAGLELWSDECKTEGNNYTEIMKQCNYLITGLNNGCGAWVVWGYNQGSTGNEFDVTKKEGMTFMKGKAIHYHMFKNFAKYIQPGSIQLKATSSNAAVKVASVINMQDSTMTIVLLNTNSQLPITVKMAGSAPATGYVAYRSSFYERCELVDIQKNGILVLAPNSITTLVVKAGSFVAKPTIDKVTDKYIAPNSSSTVNLKGITSGDPFDPAVTITVKSSNETLVPTPVITYTSPASTGTLSVSTTDVLGLSVISVTVTNSAGGDSTITFNVNPPAALNNMSDKVSVYPNPADNNISLVVPAELATSKVVISNVSGVVVMEDVLTEESQSDINISALASGVYTISINSDLGTAKVRFVKK